MNHKSCENILCNFTSSTSLSHTTFSLQILQPPLYFGIVEKNVYRSNKFDSNSFPFIRQLCLNTIVYLSREDLNPSILNFLKEENIKLINLGARKELLPYWKIISESLTKEAIECLLDKDKYPIMIMCNTGIHLTGTVIGCLRRLLHWSLTSIIDKYRNQAGAIGTRFDNEQFIELFDVDLINLPKQLPDWFLFNQQLLEKENIEKENYIIQNKDMKESNQSDLEHVSIPAYQKYLFSPIRPLTSPGVKFSVKKSIIRDDDD